MKNFMSVIILICILIWCSNKLYEKWENSEKNPFWKGTEIVQACKKPYYSTDSCYILNVTLLENKTAQINFNNGGHIIVYGLNCWFSGMVTIPRFTFCRSNDSEGNQWDLIPISVNY